MEAWVACAVRLVLGCVGVRGVVGRRLSERASGISKITGGASQQWVLWRVAACEGYDVSRAVVEISLVRPNGQ